MKCNTNTMLKTAAGLALVAGVVYFTVPAAQAFVLASAPLLVALICPISMLFMMKMMNSNGAEAGKSKDASPSHSGAPEAVMEPARQASPVPQPSGAMRLHQEGSAR